MGFKNSLGYDLLILPDHLIFLIFPKIPHEYEIILVQSKPPKPPPDQKNLSNGTAG